MLTLLAALSAHAAPWPLVVSADLLDAPQALTVFAVDPDEAVTDLGTLHRALVLDPDARTVVGPGGVEHLVSSDGIEHAFVFAGGGVAYDRLDLLDSLERFGPVSVRDFWAEAGAVLADVGLEGVDWTELKPGVAGKRIVGRGDRNGTVGAPWITHRSAAYDVEIDGMLAFGPGAEVTAVFAPGMELARFSHALRRLEPSHDAPILPPSEVVEQFSRRASETGRYNLVLASIYDIEEVEITDLRVGYYLPDSGTVVGLVEPVWELTGEIRGHDADGNPTSVDLLWYEPAIDGSGISELKVGPLL